MKEAIPDNGDYVSVEPYQEIEFLGISHNYCICYVDMIGSTDVALRIPQGKQLNTYYEIFLNSIAAIAKKFGANIIKNAGDCVICYFPDTLDYTDESAFENVYSCCFAMIEAHDSINTKLYQNELPSVNYRLSADYGKVEVARSRSSSGSDLFGSTMNLCAKINSKAPSNGLAIGRDLHDLTMSFSFSKNYHFQQIAELFVGSNHHSYLLFSVVRQKRTDHERVASGSPSPPSSFSLPSSFLQPPLLQTDYYASHLESKRSCGQVGNKKENDYHHGNILLIDDESDVLLTIKSFLTSDGYNVDAFQSAREALNHFVQPDPTQYELVVTDIRMPDLNGLQLYLRLRAINQDVRVLFVSALDAAKEVLSVLPGIKSNQILTKPVTKQQLLGAVELVLV